MVDVLAAFVICLLPFGLAALVIEGYLRMRDSYLARKRERAIREANGKVVEFKRREAA